MDSHEVNKILGALLGTVFILFSVHLASNTIFASPLPEKPGFAIEAAEPAAPGGDASAAPAGHESVLPLLASADVAAGQATFKKCQTCHDGTKGGPNKTGPNLWDVVDRPIATHEGFSYSAAMKDFSKGGTEKWTFDHLDHFLTAPKEYIKGTAMGFAGLKKTDERANLIAFLHSLSDKPVALPAADAAAPAAGDAAAAPAAGDAAAAPAAGNDAATAPAAPVKDNGNSASPEPAAPAGGGDASTPAAPAPSKDTNAAAPATGGGAKTDTPAPADNGNAAAPAPAAPAAGDATPATPAPAENGNAAAPAPAGGDAAAPATPAPAASAPATPAPATTTPPAADAPKT